MSQLWEEAKALFFRISELPESEREAFIQKHTADNPDLKALVQELVNGDTLEDEPLAASQLVSKQAKVLLEESYSAQVGDRFANYEIIDIIGEGGMGIVYSAKRVDAQFKQTVAIKVIHSKNLVLETIERFRQERKILASLQHPNIAQLVDGGETETGLPYIVMEYINGINIIDYCIKHALSINERLLLFKQVLNAVDYAHQRLVIHRDLKPSNVLVTEEGNVKLLDFGIAKLLDSNNLVDEPHLTKIEMKVMTPLNASPEQVRREQATTRTDIYGLCTLLYQMLTEKPLFETRNLTSLEIESWILDKMPTKPSGNISDSHSVNNLKIANTLTGDLDTIILKGLQKESERRYSSVEQLESDIHRYQNCFPIKAKPDSKWYVAKKFLQRNKTVSILSSIFVVLILGFMMALIHQTQQTLIQRDIALRESSNSRVVSEFLKQTFDAASPYVSGDKQLTPKDLLDNARNRLSGLDMDPILTGQLQTTLADVYLALSEFELAQELITQARDNYNSMQKPPDLLVIELEEIASKHAYFVGDLEKSVDILLPIIDKTETRLKNVESEEEFIRYQNKYIDLLLSKAASIGELDDDQVALNYAQKALSLAQKLGDKRTTPLGEIYALLGHTHRRLYNFEESEKMLILAVDEARALYGDFNLELAYAYNQLASTYSRMDQLDKGVEAAKKGFEIRNELYPNGHAEVGASLGMLANLYRQLKQYDNAIANRLKLAEMLQNLFGDNHYYVAFNALSLADLFIENDDFINADKYIELGNKVVTEQLPSGNIFYARGPLLTGKILYKQKEFIKAINSLTNAVKLSEIGAPDGHWFKGEACAYLALSHQSLMQNDLALLNKTKALEIYEKLYGIDNIRYIKIANLLKEIK